jgi:16S rRNA (uracil1498-N3)-methyltransferase
MMPKCRHEHSDQFMRLTRCYIPEPLRANETRLLPESVANHIGRVLRARAGDFLTLFDGRGGEYDAQILSIDRQAVRVQIDAHRALERESPLQITLLQALARGDRMDFIVQKATELGVGSIVAVQSERSVVRLAAEGLAKRCEHWRAIAISACEQCGRNRVPSIEASSDLAGACARAASTDRRLLLAPGAEHTLVEAVRLASSVCVLIGPEGGFAADELALSQRLGFQGCRLGPRVLRAETAPLAALAAIQSVAGDLAT